MLYQRKNRLVFLLFILPFFGRAQTEFPKEFIMHVKLGTGLVSAPNGPEIFQGNLSLVPQYTLIPYKLRGGVLAGGVYMARRMYGIGGPTVSYKLAEFKGGYFGSLGNLHINLDHLWGTGHQRLAGGGLNLDLLNKLVIGLSAHRDYHFNNWWYASSIAFRISKVAKPKETFPN